MTPEQERAAVLKLADQLRYPAMGFGRETWQGREGWERVVSTRHAWTGPIRDRLLERARQMDQTHATVRLASPFRDWYDYAAARDRGMEP